MRIRLPVIASLSRISPIMAAVPLVLCALVVVTAQTESIDDSGVKEQVRVRLVQIDVSVIDKSGSSYRSVAGLQKEDFVLRLDGKPLAPSQQDALRVDAICDDPPDDPVSRETKTIARPERPIIAFVDFNYLDAKGRHGVASAIDDLAAKAGTGTDSYKIYGFSRELRLLTDGFTRSADELRRVAETVRKTAYTRKPATGAQEFVITTPGSADEASAASMDADIPFDSGSKAYRLDVPNTGGPGEVGANVGSVASQILNELRFTDFWGDALSQYDASASIASIRSIMLAHAQLPWRKILVLFSSEAFRFTDSQRLDLELDAIRKDGRRGFSIWTVDVEGISRRGSGASRLLSSLGADTGGGSVRLTGNLAKAFENGSEQLACYYLLSLPVPIDPGKTVRRSLTVKLNRDGVSKERARQLFQYQIKAPAELIVQDERSRLAESRLSALLSPDDYRDLPVSVTLDYPVEIDGKRILKTRIRVPLVQLDWEPVGGATGSWAARVLPAAIVERHTPRGHETVCGVDADTVGPLTVKLTKDPATVGRQALAIELSCVFGKDGLYAARGIVTDLASGETGAGRSTVFFDTTGSQQWQVHGPRVEAVSGLDFIWRPGLKQAQRDSGKRAWREASLRSPVVPDDEISLRYVLCGPDSSTAAPSLRHVLVRRDADDKIVPILAFKSESLLILGDATSGSFCAEAVVLVPSFSIVEPGEYAFAVLDEHATDEDAYRRLARVFETTRPDVGPDGGLLAAVAFALEHD